MPVQPEDHRAPPNKSLIYLPHLYWTISYMAGVSLFCIPYVPLYG